MIFNLYIDQTLMWDDQQAAVMTRCSSTTDVSVVNTRTTKPGTTGLLLCLQHFSKEPVLDVIHDCEQKQVDLT